MTLEVINIWFLIPEAVRVTTENTLHRDHVPDTDPGDHGAAGDGAGLCEPHRQGGRGPAQV